MIRLVQTSKKMDPMHLCSVFHMLPDWVPGYIHEQYGAGQIDRASPHEWSAVPGVTQVTEVTEVTAGTAWAIVSV